MQELQLAATLIKQFTHWLPSTSDPHHAQARFRELVARLQPASEWPDKVGFSRCGSSRCTLRLREYLGLVSIFGTFCSRGIRNCSSLANAEALGIRECRVLSLNRMPAYRHAAYK
ncbi:MAG: hypothetical protein U0936_16795 [Planctomycetaceae bacterium]